MPKFTDRLMHAWNAFKYEETTGYRTYKEIGNSSYAYPDKPRLTRSNDRTIISAVYNRIATDCSLIDVKHIYVDEDGKFLSVCEGPLNDCFTYSANIDQTGRQLIHDTVLTILDDGCAAVVPVDTDKNPNISDAFKINSMRVGRVREWYPRHIKVELYNDQNGKYEEITMPKSAVAIIQNPFYAIMNEPNSTVKRLVHKLDLLDAIDEQSSAGKLDLIVQLPYAARTALQKEQAANRRKEIEEQLADSKYGIVYTDGTEKVTQINRPLENNLMDQIEYLETVMYSQLGITQDLMSGAADEEELTVYYSRLIEPLMDALVEEFRRKFISNWARTRGQTIRYFRDPFKLVPVNQIPDMADKLTRNEIMTSNEVRALIGLAPAKDPEADVLRNKNINKAAGQEDVDSMTGNTIDVNGEEVPSMAPGEVNVNGEESSPPEGEEPLNAEELTNLKNQAYDEAMAQPYVIDGDDELEKKLDELEAMLDESEKRPSNSQKK